METEEILVAIQNAAETIATPNWADIASVGLSLLAVVVAGFVAWKQVKIAKKQNEIAEKQAGIAGQQNRIALFEKRYKIYDKLSKIFTLTNNSEFLGNQTLYGYYVMVLLMLDYPEPQENSTDIFIYTLEMNKTVFLIQQSTFLFPNVLREDIDDFAEKFRKFFAYLVTTAPEKREVKLTECFEASLVDFIKVSNSFSAKYLDIIKESLKL